MELLSKYHDLSLPAVADIDEFECVLQSFVEKMAGWLLNQLIERFEKDWRSSAGKGFLSKGRQTRTIVTTFGEFQLQRRKFYDPSGKKTVIPFDQHFGSERQSKAVKTIAVHLASEVSFMKASKFLRLTLGVNRSAKRVWKDLQEAGETLDQALEEQSKHMYSSGEVLDAKQVSHDVLALEADGTFVKGRQRGQAHEVKLAIAYTGKIKRGKNRWLLTNKQAWGGVTSSAVFAERLGFVLEQQYSLSTAKRFVGRSDGGEWIKTVFESFPVRLTHQLDLHHLLVNLRQAVPDLEGLSECQKFAYKGDGKSLLMRLRRRAGHLKNKRALAATLSAVTYVRNNLDRIDSLKHYRKQSVSLQERKMYCRGSGAIERNISLFVCDRMKHRRMHWSPAGAHRMTQVRTALLNNSDATLFN
jgi:hypothetical protein